MNEKIAIVNPIFSLEACPPSILASIANIKGMLSTYETRTFDLDIGYFNYSENDNIKYTLMQYVIGGFSFSYPLSAKVDSNYYPFETMPSAELVLAMCLNFNVEEATMNICESLSVNFDDANLVVKGFLDYMTKSALSIKEYTTVIINGMSISSIYSSIVLAQRLKAYNNDIKIIICGKNALIPEIKKFVDTLKLFDIFMIDYSELSRYFVIDSEKLSYLDFSDMNKSLYKTKLGMHSVILNSSKGCPHNCYFCSIRLRWNENEVFDTYEVEDINLIIIKLGWIKKIFGQCFVCFQNCTFNVEQQYFNELLIELKKTGLFYSCNLRADNVNEEYINKLKEANFYEVIVGVETVSERTARVLNKGSSEYVKKVRTAIPLMKKKGLNVQLNVLLFYPGMSSEEVAEDICCWEEFARFLNNEGVDFTNAYVGTLCINYPSKMYFQVLENMKYKIVYHTLPNIYKDRVSEDVNKAYENIPLSAILMEPQGEIINKLDYVKRIYELWNPNKNAQLQNYLNLIIGFADKIVHTWRENKVQIAFCNVPGYELLRDKDVYYIYECVNKLNNNASDIVSKYDGDAKKIIGIIASLELFELLKIQVGS